VSADASGLRRGLTRWGEQVVRQAARNTASKVVRDRRVLKARRPASTPSNGRVGERKPPTTSGLAARGTSARFHIETWGWRWRPGSSLRPFAPTQHHQDLAGVVFTDWDDDRLRNTTTRWLPVSHYYPGDHVGCLCSAPPTRAPADLRVWRPVLEETIRRELLAAARSVRFTA